MQCDVTLKYVDLAIVQVNGAELIYSLMVMKWNYLKIVYIYDLVLCDQ